MNASLALTSANIVKDLDEGISIAKNSIEEGKAFQKLESFIEVSGGSKEKLNNLL